MDMFSDEIVGCKQKPGTFDEALVRVIFLIENEADFYSQNALQIIGTIILAIDAELVSANRRLTLALAYASKANDLQLDEFESGAMHIARHLGVKLSAKKVNNKENGSDREGITKNVISADETPVSSFWSPPTLHQERVVPPRGRSLVNFSSGRSRGLF